jgi:hypothetical protein
MEMPDVELLVSQYVGTSLYIGQLAWVAGGSVCHTVPQDSVSTLRRIQLLFSQ